MAHVQQRGRRAGQRVQAARRRLVEVEDQTYTDLVPRVALTNRVGDGELLAYLRQQATGRQRTVQLEVGLWQKGAAWLRMKDDNITEVRIERLLRQCVPLVMKETPGDRALAACVANRTFYQSLQRANEYAAGVYKNQKVSWTTALGIGSALGLLGAAGARRVTSNNKLVIGVAAVAAIATTAAARWFGRTTRTIPLR